MLVFLNGKFVPEEKAVVSVFDRSFLYGDGLFETMRIAHGRPFRWEQHMQRLQHGAAFLRIKLPFSSAKLHAFAIKLAAKNKARDTLLRLTLSRGIGAPGYSPRNAKAPAIVMSLRPLPKMGQGKVAQWNLITLSFRLPAGDSLAAFKTCNKLAQVMARVEADAAGADEALLANTNSFIVEGASSNLFWLRRGILFTPPLAAGILPGVTRTVVMEIASRLKIPVRQKNIRLKELLQSDGVFLSLSSFGVVEAKLLDGHVLKKSPLVAQIAHSYEELLLNSSACNTGSEA